MKKLKPKYLCAISCNWAFIGRHAFLGREEVRCYVLDMLMMKSLVV